jgi:hypothetical protein
MDVAGIRSRFIQESLRRALNECDRYAAWIIASEFRLYFQWFKDSLPASDQQVIVEQLRQLESLNPPDPQKSDHAWAA